MRVLEMRKDHYSAAQHAIAVAKAINNVIIIPILLADITNSLLCGIAWIVFTGFVYDVIFSQNEDKKINADMYKLLILSIIFVMFFTVITTEIAITYL